MFRNFTYIDDIGHGIRLLMDAVPERPADGAVPKGDNLSPVEPFRIVKIGNSDKARLLEFIDAIEASLGKNATRSYTDMQKGEASATWADASLRRRSSGCLPKNRFLRKGKSVRCVVSRVFGQMKVVASPSFKHSKTWTASKLSMHTETAAHEWAGLPDPFPFAAPRG